MQDYLDYKFEDSAAFVATFDEAPLWSASFGLLLLEQVELKRDMHIVDIGCGAGFPLLELAGRCGNSCKLYGIDPWTNALARARKKLENYGYDNVVLIEAAADKMPFGDKAIDLVVSNLGINNFDNPAVVFTECKRVLKPGGRLALTTNINGHWKLFYTVFERVLLKLGKEAYIEKLKAEQAHRGTVETVSKLYTDAGFKITKLVNKVLEMKFTDGTAFLNHHFVKLGWLGSWLQLFPEAEHRAIFSALEDELNQYAIAMNGLHLEVPMLYMEGEA